MEFDDRDNAEEMLGHLFNVWNRLQKENAENKLRFPFDLNGRQAPPPTLFLKYSIPGTS